MVFEYVCYMQCTGQRATKLPVLFLVQVMYFHRSRNFHVLKIIIIIRMINFRVVKFSRCHSIHKIFVTVDDYNMDECLESCWHLVYYQVSGQPRFAHCSRRSDIYLGECGLAHKLIDWSSPRNLFFACLIFTVSLDREIILTVKFSKSTVWHFNTWQCHVYTYNIGYVSNIPVMVPDTHWYFVVDKIPEIPW